MTISSNAVGLTGFCLTGMLWLLGIWRIGHHFSKGCCRCTFRRVFHLLFVVAMLLEWVSYADLCRLIPLSQNRDVADKWGYILLEICGRSVLEVFTFSIVTVLWLQTATEGSENNINNSPVATPNSTSPATSPSATKQKRLIRILIVAVSVITVLGISTLQALDILLNHPDWIILSSATIYQLHVFVEATCWAIHSIMASWSGYLTVKKILGLSSYYYSRSDLSHWRLVIKATLPMAFCSLAYACRSIYLWQDLLFSKSIQERTQLVQFWIVFAWLPTIIPSLCLLYSARKRSTDIGISNEDAQEPLLFTSSPPRPPAEAFISFQNLAAAASPIFVRLESSIDDDEDDDITEAATNTNHYARDEVW